MSARPLLKFMLYSMKVRQTVIEFPASRHKAQLHLHRISYFTERPSSELHELFVLQIDRHQIFMVVRFTAEPSLDLCSQFLQECYFVTKREGLFGNRYFFFCRVSWYSTLLIE